MGAKRETGRPKSNQTVSVPTMGPDLASARVVVNMRRPRPFDQKTSSAVRCSHTTRRGREIPMSIILIYGRSFLSTAAGSVADLSNSR